MIVNLNHSESRMLLTDATADDGHINDIEYDTQSICVHSWIEAIATLRPPKNWSTWGLQGSDML